MTTHILFMTIKPPGKPITAPGTTSTPLISLLSDHKPCSAMTQPLISVKNEDLEKARQVKAIIEKEYSSPLTVDALVHRVSTNKFKLKFSFKEVAHCTVH